MCVLCNGVPFVLDHHWLAALAVAGGVLGVLGSLYLTDDLLEHRYVLLRMITVFFTFGIPIGVGLGLVGGPVAGLLTGTSQGLWMALRVGSGRFGGYSFAGLLQWSIAFGFVVLLTTGPALGGTAALSAFFSGSAGYVLPYLRVAGNTKIPRRTVTRESLITGILLLFIGLPILLSGAWVLWKLGLLYAPVKANYPLVIAMGVIGGVFGARGPQMVRWASSLPQGRLGAIGVALILLSFIAETVQPLAELLNIPVR